MRYGWLKTQCVWSAASHPSAVTFLNGFTATPEVVRSIRSLHEYLGKAALGFFDPPSEK
jgi:hypothetical protein